MAECAGIVQNLRKVYSTDSIVHSAQTYVWLHDTFYAIHLTGKDGDWYIYPEFSEFLVFEIPKNPHKNQSTMLLVQRQISQKYGFLCTYIGCFRLAKYCGQNVRPQSQLFPYCGYFFKIHRNNLQSTSGHPSHPQPNIINSSFCTIVSLLLTNLNQYFTDDSIETNMFLGYS